MLDGPDFAAAAATAATVASLARVAGSSRPALAWSSPALLVLVVAVGVRAAARGVAARAGTLGVTLGGAVVAAIAGFAALRVGPAVLAAPGPLWDADLAR